MSRFGGVLVAVVLCLFGAFVVGCGGDDGPSQEQLEQAREEGAKEAREQAKIDQLQKELKRLKQQAKMNSGKSGGNSGQSNEGRGDGYYENSAGGPVSSCSGNVRVGPNTSCDFAMNVAGEYGSNPGASTINAFSPATGEHYTLSCGPWSGGGTVCAGGNGAAVYLP